MKNSNKIFTRTIHIKDATSAYNKTNRKALPEYAKPFELAMVTAMVRRVNSEGSKHLVELTEEQYQSYIAILNN